MALRWLRLLVFSLASFLLSGRTWGFLWRPCQSVRPRSSLRSRRALVTARGAVPPEAALIETAERFMNNGGGYFNPLNMSMLAEDFVFRGPVIGPLNKPDYKRALDYFSLYKAFPDISPNCFGFNVDPEDPLRVWFFVRASGTNSAKVGGFFGKAAALVTSPDQGTKLRGSPEAWSLTFNEDLQVRLVTAGYVVDRFARDTTTGGRGLTFGVLATLGLPLPIEPADWRLRAIQAVNGPLVDAGLSPIAVSRPEDVPKWWTDERRGADP
mmetsp:Transcript_55621/g.178450  ORF Transcript_55621/g.178450 Transcript_55621/m.178450 type:complete len:268 (-) Transcript_55621:220-1023(-)